MEKLPSFTNKNTNKLMLKQFALQFNQVMKSLGVTDDIPLTENQSYYVLV